MARFLQCGGERAGGGHVEDGLDRSGVRTGADEIGLGTTASDEQEGIDDDRLAGSRLAREHVEAGGERDARFLENGEIPYGKLAQHGGPDAKSQGRSRSNRISLATGGTGPGGPYSSPRAA